MEILKSRHVTSYYWPDIEHHGTNIAQHWWMKLDPPFNQAPFVQRVDKAIQSINPFSLDTGSLGFPNTYPLDSDLYYHVDSAVHRLNNWGQTFRSPAM